MKYYVLQWDIYTANFEIIKVCDTKEEAVELSSQPWRYYEDEQHFKDLTAELKSLGKNV